jgi:hypothetical protein
MVRAAACNYWAQGIDGLYMARGWFYNYPYESTFYEKLREMPQPDIMAPKDKYYRLPSYGAGAKPDSGPGSRMDLPAILELNQPAGINFAISDDLPKWDIVGRVYEVLLRVSVTGSTELDRFSFCLNGKELPSNMLRKINEMIWLTGPRGGGSGGYWFVYTLNEDNWPVEGNNLLEVTLDHRDPDVISDVTVRQVELETKYLMGKNFRRGFVDPALGPYEDRVGGPW